MRDLERIDERVEASSSSRRQKDCEKKEADCPSRGKTAIKPETAKQSTISSKKTFLQSQRREKHSAAQLTVPHSGAGGLTANRLTSEAPDHTVAELLPKPDRENFPSDGGPRCCELPQGDARVPTANQ